MKSRASLNSVYSPQRSVHRENLNSVEKSSITNWSRNSSLKFSYSKVSIST